MERFTGLLGILVIMAVAYWFSDNRRAIQPRVIYWGLGLQLGFAFLVLKTPLAEGFRSISDGVNRLLGYSIEGSKFVFGDKLGAPNDQFGVVFAFQVLPIIIFIASVFDECRSCDVPVAVRAPDCAPYRQVESKWKQTSSSSSIFFSLPRL